MTAAATHPGASRRLVRHEVVRMRSVRSTWVLLGLAVLSSAISLVSAHSLLNSGPSAVDTISAPFAYTSILMAPEATLSVLAGVFGAMALGHDFRYGTVQTTVVRFPRRVPLLLVKLLVTTTAAASVGLLVVGLGLGLVSLDHTWAEIGGSAVPATTQAGLLLRLTLVLVGYAAIGFCVTALTRSLQMGIALPLLWSNVVEPILLLTGVATGGPLQYLLPYRNGRSALLGPVGDVLPLGGTADPWTSLLLFLVQVGLLLALATWSFRRADL